MSDYPRWRAAEASGRDDDADEAFRAVFESALEEQPVALEFTTRTMTAVAAAAARDARRARRARTALVAGAVAAAAVGVYAGFGWAVAFISDALLGLLNLFVAAAVRIAQSFESGAGAWGLISSLGQAAAAVAADPNVTVAMIAISAVAIAALAVLQRLLGSDEESFQ